jgi:hypothetical protein
VIQDLFRALRTGIKAARDEFKRRRWLREWNAGQDTPFN